MKKNFNWMLTVILLSGQMMLTSCEKYVEDTVEGLFKPLHDAAEQYTEEKRQEMLDNLFNWRMGSTTDQASIDKYGYNNCFQVVSLTPDFWTSNDAPEINPSCDKEQLCLVRFLSHSKFGLIVGGIVCNQSIGGDLVTIFRQLYESGYRIDRPCTASGYCLETLTLYNCTYSYFYNERNPMSATYMQQQGLGVVLNAATPITSEDPAVLLFKERGFKWGGDEPNGNVNYFEK